MIKEYLSSVISFQRQKALKKLLLRFWVLINSFLAYILIFAFWLSLIDFPFSGKLGIWSVFGGWMIYYLYQPFSMWFKLSKPDEKLLEENLRSLNNEYPEIEKLLSAYFLDKRYQKQKNPILISASRQKLDAYKLPQFKIPPLPLRSIITHSILLIILFSAAMASGIDNFLPNVRKVFFIENVHDDSQKVYVNFDKQAYRVLEKDTLLLAGSLSRSVDRGLLLRITSISNENLKSVIIPEISDRSFLSQTLLPPGMYRLHAEIEDHSMTLASDTAKINVLKKPFIKYFDVRVVPPLYSGLSAHTFKDNGNFSILPGTRIFINGYLNKEIKSMAVVLNDRRVLPGKFELNNFSAAFSGKNVQKWYLQLMDEDSLLLATDPPYNISYLEDIPPNIRIDEPPGDVKIFDISFMPLRYTVEDDYGISRISLNFRVLREGFAAGPMESIDLQSQIIVDLPYRDKYIWDLNQLNVFAGETIEYFLKTWDNNSVTGFSSAVTDTYRIYIPSIFENLTASEQQKTDIEEQIENAKKSAKEIEEKLAELKRKLKQKEKFDFQLKTEGREQLKNQEELFNEINELSEKIQKKIDELEKQSEISSETVEKYKDIQDLLQDLLPPELKEQLKRLQELLEKEDAKNFTNQLEQFDRKKFSDEIDRLHELMKKLQTEMTLEDLKNAFSKLAEMQRQVTDSIKNERWNKAGAREYMIQEDYRAVRSTLEELIKAADNGNIALPDSSRNSISTEKQQKTEEHIKDLQRDISEKKMTSSQKSQSLSQEFSKNAGLMKDMQNNFQSQNKEALIRKLEDAISAAMSISKEQEMNRAVAKKITSMSTSQPLLSKRQAQLANQMTYLKKDFVNIANETFLFPKIIMDRANKAESNMLNAAEQLSQKRIANAKNSQNNAQSEMNLLTMQLLKTFNSVQSSKSGSGAENFMEMMEKMAGMQGQLNNESMMMYQSGGGSPSDMGRMAARQRAIRDALSEAMEKSQGQGGLSGRMDQVADEMEKIAELLDKGRLDAQILERQEKLFNRMLDSQKSLRQKEFSKKREAEKALPYVVVKPRAERDVINSEQLWEHYFRELLKQKFQDQTLKHVRQFYENVD